MAAIRFQIETGSGTQGTSVRIRDEKSGVTIASFQLSPEQTFDFLRGHSMTLEGEITSKLDRVGKEMVHEGVEVPDSEVNRWPYGERVTAGERWARTEHPGWDSYEARRTNTGGVNVILRKWVES